MSRRRLNGFAAIAMMAAFLVTPAVAQAGPLWRMNGLVAKQIENVVQFGTLTMKSPFLGEIKCNVLVGAPISNESERGVAPVQGWETWSCDMPECHGPVSVMAEHPPTLFEPPVKPPVAQRGEKTLPWPAELTAPEGRTSLRMGNTEKLPVEPVKFWIACPREGFEVTYEGTLGPHVVNGTKNGLKPSRLEFEGEGGKTGFLKSPDIFGGKEPQSLLFIKGELTLLGTGQQLVTAE